MSKRKKSMKKKQVIKWLKIIWDFLNKPLIVILIIAGIYLLVGHQEKVRCDFMVSPNADYLRNEGNMSEETIAAFLKFYREPFKANLTFDNYQDALAFKELAIDGQNHKEWYTPTVDCDEFKIELPAKFEDAIK